MSNFKEDFKREIEEEREFAPIHRFNNLRRDYDGFICFVEGRSDEEFYSRVNIPVLNTNCRYIYRFKGDVRSTDDKYENIRGKEAVLYCYDIIKKNNILSKENKRCCYIVDQDFDGIFSEKVEFDDRDKKNITVTYFHSMESYFIYRENITRIFRLLNLTDEDTINFIDKINVFAGLTADYFSLKSAITNDIKQRNKGNSEGIFYKKSNTADEIFIFDFTASPFFNEHLLDKEVEIMRNAISAKKFKRAQTFYKTIKERILSGPGYIRGHTTFDFLMEYLIQIHKIEILENKNLYYEIISNLKVPIEIKKGNGKIIHSMHPSSFSD